jgi:hypothetical protein
MKMMDEVFDDENQNQLMKIEVRHSHSRRVMNRMIMQWRPESWDSENQKIRMVGRNRNQED